MIRALFFGIAAIVVGAALGASAFREKMIREGFFVPPKEIYVNPGDIHGTFGERLGDPLQITGKEGRPTMAWGQSFDVTEANGKHLNEPVGVYVRWDYYGHLKKEDTNIEKGFVYTFIGYETGMFESEPTWVAPQAQQSFGFHIYFLPTELVSKTPIPGEGNEATTNAASINR
jgi:hypothetical protein